MASSVIVLAGSLEYGVSATGPFEDSEKAKEYLRRLNMRQGGDAVLEGSFIAEWVKLGEPEAELLKHPAPTGPLNWQDGLLCLVDCRGIAEVKGVSYPHLWARRYEITLDHGGNYDAVVEDWDLNMERPCNVLSLGNFPTKHEAMCACEKHNRETPVQF